MRFYNSQMYFYSAQTYTRRAMTEHSLLIHGTCMAVHAGPYYSIILWMLQNCSNRRDWAVGWVCTQLSTNFMNFLRTVQDVSKHGLQGVAGGGGGGPKGLKHPLHSGVVLVKWNEMTKFEVFPLALVVVLVTTSWNAQIWDEHPHPPPPPRPVQATPLDGVCKDHRACHKKSSTHSCHELGFGLAKSH